MRSILLPPGGMTRDFDRVADEERARLVRYFDQALRDAGLAEDLTQETFLQAARGWPAFRGECSPRTWLRRIAANVLRDHWRARGSEKRAGLGAGPEEDDLQLADSQESPALALERREVRTCLGRLMARLPSGEREVLHLAIQGAVPPREIAQSLRLTPEAVRARLHRARRKLAAMVARRCTLVTDGGGALSCEARNPLTSRLQGDPALESPST